MNARLPFQAFGLGLLILVANPAPALQRDVSDFETRIAKLNAQIRDLRAKLADEEKRESSILSALERIGLRKRLIRAELAAGAVAVERTDGELEALRKEIALRRTALESERRSVERTLVTLYKFGQFDLLQFVLRSKNIEAFLAESKNLAFLARYQNDVVAGYLASLSKLSASEARLEAKKGEIAGLLRAAGEKKKELEAEERKNRELVARVQRNKSSYAQALEELAESGRQLQALMKRIVDEKYQLPYPFVPLYEKKGQLAWPVSGRIITPFGAQKHPRFNTITTNNGIEIAPMKERAPVLAVHPGRVVYADAFEGYGNLIIVDHGLTYYTLYGHCSEFLAAKGDAVRAGQAVALSGDSGSLKGECLYFEIRFRTKALDPLKWLKRR
jgi:septal ring factor EnvC (AmiA/AmiB activator)